MLYYYHSYVIVTYAVKQKIQSFEHNSQIFLHKKQSDHVNLEYQNMFHIFGRLY